MFYSLCMKNPCTLKYLIFCAVSLFPIWYIWQTVSNTVEFWLKPTFSGKTPLTTNPSEDGVCPLHPLCYGSTTYTPLLWHLLYFTVAIFPAHLEPVIERGKTRICPIYLSIQLHSGIEWIFDKWMQEWSEVGNKSCKIVWNRSCFLKCQQCSN